MINDVDHVDFIPSNVQSSHQEALLYVFEDNEAVINMIFGVLPKALHAKTCKWWYSPNGHVAKVPGKGDCQSRPLAIFFQVGRSGLPFRM